MCSELATESELKEKGFTNYGYHVVCLIDVLGQKDKLKDWDMQENGEPSQKGFKVVDQTIGTLRTFRDYFLDWFKEMAEVSDLNEIASLSAEVQAKYHRYSEGEVMFERFSDTFVFHSPVQNSSGDTSVIALAKIMVTCSNTMIESLANFKTPVRGAITIGLGAVLDDNSFYGPALAEAHHLESEVASYPRIIVSDKVIELLKQSEPYSQDTDIDTAINILAEQCRSIIFQDVDGFWAMDFIGKGIYEILNQETNLSNKNKFEKAYSFVRSEAKRFRESRSVRSEANRFRDSEDAKLAVRYYLLQQYFESRLSIWGIKTEEVAS